MKVCLMAYQVTGQELHEWFGAGMLLKKVVFFDFEKSATLVFFEYASMMGAWVFISYYVAKALIFPHGKRKAK